MEITYEPWPSRKGPNDEHRTIIAMADQICRDYQAQGYDLTLRQLYYQFVARDLIANTLQSYKRLGGIINDARMAGLLDWDFIVDRTRNLLGTSHWSQPGQVIRSAASSYRIDKWEDQPVRVEVWVEKEALAGVIARAARTHDLDYFSCRGYVSQSEQWAAAQRIGGYLAGGQRVVILHLGDHDPSGIDMTRDITDRLRRFTLVDWWRTELGNDSDFEPEYDEPEVVDSINERVGLENSYEDYLTINRIALNYDQVQQYNPPPNPAKITDSRAEGYIARHGRLSWELDALDPATLVDLINDEVLTLRDPDRWFAKVDREEEERANLSTMADRYSDIVTFLGSTS